MDNMKVEPEHLHGPLVAGCGAAHVCQRVKPFVVTCSSQLRDSFTIGTLSELELLNPARLGRIRHREAEEIFPPVSCRKTCVGEENSP